jgi:hypothetical protein
LEEAYVTYDDGTGEAEVGAVQQVSYKAKFENCTRTTKVNDVETIYTLKIKTVYVYNSKDEGAECQFETYVLIEKIENAEYPALTEFFDSVEASIEVDDEENSDPDGDALASTELEQEEEEPEQTEATEPTEPAETEQPEETTTPTEQPEATAPTETVEPEETTAPAETEQPEATAASEPVEAEEIMAADVEAE